MPEPTIRDLVRLHEMEVEAHRLRLDRSIFTDPQGPEWGTRAAGAMLCAVASWALWMDLVYKPSLWCR